MDKTQAKAILSIADKQAQATENLKKFKANVEAFMAKVCGGAKLSYDSGNPGFEGGWLDQHPMWHGVSMGFFVEPEGNHHKYIVNLNQKTGRFTIYKHISTQEQPFPVETL